MRPRLPEALSPGTHQGSSKSQARSLIMSGFALPRSWFTYVRLFYLGERDMTYDADKLTIKLQFPSDPDLTLTFFDRARCAEVVRYVE